MCLEIQSYEYIYIIYLIGLTAANEEYSKKVAGSSSTNKTLFRLGWKLDELSRLSGVGRQLCVDVNHVLESIRDRVVDVNDSNFRNKCLRL